MFLSVYRFAGDPAALMPAYRRLLERIPAGNLHLHACVARPGGLAMYDACPTREDFEAFSTGAGFRGLLAEAGLPAPEIEPLGDIACLYLEGRPVI